MGNANGKRGKGRLNKKGKGKGKGNANGNPIDEPMPNIDENGNVIDQPMPNIDENENNANGGDGNNGNNLNKRKSKNNRNLMSALNNGQGGSGKDKTLKAPKDDEKADEDDTCEGKDCDDYSKFNNKIKPRNGKGKGSKENTQDKKLANKFIKKLKKIVDGKGKKPKNNSSDPNSPAGQENTNENPEDNANGDNPNGDNPNGDNPNDSPIKNISGGYKPKGGKGKAHELNININLHKGKGKLASVTGKKRSSSSKHYTSR